MKSIKLIIPSIILLVLLCCNNSYSQTTLEEFNYITKGYQIQIESGLDTKSGYTIQDIGDWGITYDDFARKAQFKLLYKEDNNVPQAIIMILYRTDTDTKAYVCIPSFSSELEIWEKAFDHFSEITAEWDEVGVAYYWGTLRMLSYSLTQ